MSSGDLKVFVAKEFPLDQCAAAHELSEGGHVRGKIVIRAATDDVGLAGEPAGTSS